MVSWLIAWPTPRYGVAKTYLADVAAPLPRDLGRRLLAGIELEDGVASADKFRVVEQAGSRALVEITLHEGRKHIVRRLLAEAEPSGQPPGPHPGRPRHARQPPARQYPGADHQEIGELYAAVGL